MDNYNNTIIYALENALIKMNYYVQSGDTYHLSQSSDWIDVAKIYMKEIIPNNEYCNN